MTAKSVIDQLKERTDIVTIAESIGVKGARYKANICCPLHDDKNPSFRFYENGTFRCFSGSCIDTGNISNDVIGFVQLYNNCSFKEAVTTIAGIVGFELPASDTPKKESPESEALSLAQYFFKKKFAEDPAALNYLISRGFTEETISTFEFGYAPPYNSLCRYGKKHLEGLKNVALVCQGDNGDYDFFRSRLTIPIHTRYGAVTGFSGRTLNDQKPKYINSQDSDWFHKGELLYNHHRVSPSERTCIVPEGYLDVASLWQAGHKNALCSMGTAITEKQILLLAQRFDDVVFMLDGDEAGRKASWRVARMLLPHTDKAVSFRFAFLPEGKDPCDLAMELGRDGIQSLVDGAVFLSDFIVAEVKKLTDMRGGLAESMQALQERVNALIAEAPPSVFKETLTYQLASIINANIIVGSVIKIHSKENPDLIKKLMEALQPFAGEISLEVLDECLLVRKK